MLANIETSDDVGLKAIFAAFVTKLGVITRLRAAQALPTQGRVEERDRVFAETTAATLAVAGRVLAYAEINQLPDLALRVRLNDNPSHSLRLGSRVSVMQQVHDAAHSVLPELAGLGGTAATLAELQTQIDAAAAVATSPRTTVAARKVATAQLAAAFTDMEAFLTGQLDPVMRGAADESHVLRHLPSGAHGDRPLGSFHSGNLHFGRVRPERRCRRHGVAGCHGAYSIRRPAFTTPRRLIGSGSVRSATPPAWRFLRLLSARSNGLRSSARRAVFPRERDALRGGFLG